MASVKGGKRTGGKTKKKAADGLTGELLVQVPLTGVKMISGFWHKRQEVNRKVSIPHQHYVCVSTGRMDAWKVDKAGGPGSPKTHLFWDSDVAKWAEAAAFALAGQRDAKVEGLIDAWVDEMERVQQDDGYLNTHFTAVGLEKRWSNLRDDHELYCAGHLMEAAVAYFDATGKRKMLDVVCRFADHIAQKFGTGPGQVPGYCGHEEIELALVKLARATGNEKYLELSRYFVTQRGTQPHFDQVELERWGNKLPGGEADAKRYEYNQAHLPVVRQTAVVGHAVRAMYLYCAMADLAREYKDGALHEACLKLWKDLTTKKLYITGGIGPSRKNEGFTEDYDLPNESAYCETCASVGLALWAHRMNELTPDRRYGDMFERCIYNGAMSGMSLDGKKYFYENPLESKGGHRRKESFDCGCCPSNISRLVASLNQFMYSTREGQDGGTVFVHHYAHCEANVSVDGVDVKVLQETQYPWDGRVDLTVSGFEKTARFTLALRLPAWCRRAKLSVNGKALGLGTITRAGYAYVSRAWKAGDVVRLDLPMPVEHMEASPNVRADFGRVALQRGPVVYCLEEVDNGAGLNQMVLPEKGKFAAKYAAKVLDGVTVITGTGLRKDVTRWADGELYKPGRSKGKKVKITAVPYFAWDNRKGGEMVVWVIGGTR